MVYLIDLANSSRHSYRNYLLMFLSIWNHVNYKLGLSVLHSFDVRVPGDDVMVLVPVKAAIWSSRFYDAGTFQRHGGHTRFGTIDYKTRRGKACRDN